MKNGMLYAGLVLMVVVIVVIVVIVLMNNSGKKDVKSVKSEFVDDMKSITLPSSITTITGSNKLDDKFIVYVYNKYQTKINNIYHNSVNKKLFENIITGTNRKKCLNEILLLDFVNAFQTIAGKLMDSKPKMVKTMAALIVTMIIDHKRTSTSHDMSGSDLSSLMALGSSKSIWIKPRYAGGVGTGFVTLDDLIKAGAITNSGMVGGTNYTVHLSILLPYLMSTTLNISNLNDGFNKPINNFIQNNVKDFMGRDCFGQNVPQTSQNDILSLVNSITTELINNMIKYLDPISGGGGLGPVLPPFK